MGGWGDGEVWGGVGSVGRWGDREVWGVWGLNLGLILEEI
ncbi:hypothetical protein NSTC745_03575 [Nostoc sp. DSM 114161]|jgi:hypothetical protein